MDVASAKEDSMSEDEEWARVIKKKEEEVKHLCEKEEQLCQKELHYQREKEVLLRQYKLVFPDKPGWSREPKRSHEQKSIADKRYREVCELVSDIHQQEMQQQKLWLEVHKKKARNILAEVDDALKLEKEEYSNFGPETPLLRWYIKIKEYIKMDEGQQMQSVPLTEKPLSMTDKMFYHVKYQRRDGNHDLKKVIPLGQPHQSFPGNWCGKLSFSTRHKGTCVIVTITRNDSSSAKPTGIPGNFSQESTSYTFSTDPHVTNCQKCGLEFLLRNEQPENFVKEVVWNYIETEL